MHLTVEPGNVRVGDPIAEAVEDHLREMHSDGYGELVTERNSKGIVVGFGGVWAQGDNYDIALIRLAGALLSDVRLGEVFLRRIRGTIPLAAH